MVFSRGKKKMTLRRYEEGDRERVEEICRITDNSNLENELLLTLYCRYYTTYEKENCFVSVVDGIVAGYIISAEDTLLWKDRFTSNLLSHSTEEIREKGMESIEGYLPFYPEYPAHLHIDIDPRFQRMGIGHALMDALLSAYREKGVKGVMLGVDPENLKGVSFYKKYGFVPLDQSGVWWGIKP